MSASQSSQSQLSEAERNLLQSADNTNTSPHPLLKFVFTGGPCGGKTTALARVFMFLRERGFEVITVPETFTVLSSNGMAADFFATEGMDKIIQGTVLDIQLKMEDSVQRLLRARGKPAVVLCDRGTMDGAVYVSKETFQQIMTERNTDIVELRDNRYNAIFHLVTAADGAEGYYTLENNKVRSESPEQARECDRKTQQAWVGSPHLFVLDNSTDFEGKMTRLVDIISKLVGLPSNLKRSSAKFLLRRAPELSEFPQDVDVQVFEVEKVYLRAPPRDDDEEDKSDKEYSFIRRRTNIDPQTGQLVGSVYGLTRAKYVIGTGSSSNLCADDAGEVIEQKRIISQREYMAAYMTRDHRRHVIRQRRISFLYAQQSFNVHIYEGPPADGLCILHAQVQARRRRPRTAETAEAEAEAATAEEETPEHVDLPPFLDVERRILNTKEDEAKYGAYSLSVIK